MKTCEIERDAADKAEATPGDWEGYGVQGEVVLWGRVIVLLRHAGEFPPAKPTAVVDGYRTHVMSGLRKVLLRALQYGRPRVGGNGPLDISQVEEAARPNFGAGESKTSCFSGSHEVQDGEGGGVGGSMVG